MSEKNWLELVSTDDEPVLVQISAIKFIAPLRENKESKEMSVIRFGSGLSLHVLDSYAEIFDLLQRE